MHSFWLYNSNQSSSVKERALPGGTVEIVFNLHDDVVQVSNSKDKTGLRSFRHALVSGPQSKFFDGEIPARASLIGVHFKPGGAYPFLGLPANELLNSIEPLDALWGGRAVSLRERLLEANGTTSKFRILEDFFLTEMRRCLPLNSAVEFAVNKLHWASSSSRISEITGKLGMSPRNFIEIFSKQVGLTPKLFSRLQRFQRVVRFTETVHKIKWNDFCLKCGYYDQAHLIHDFRTFAGCTPTDYLHRKTGRLNHVST